MKNSRWLALGCVLVGIVACGGTSSDLIGPGADGGSSGDGGGSGDSGSRSDGATGGDSGGSDAAPINDSGICPDIKGRYTITHSGLGCGDIVNDAPQCIDQSNASCDADIQSKHPDGGEALGVNGIASLQADGSFSGASLTLGTVGRSGCAGSWDDGSQTLTIICGGTGVDQSCTVTLTRNGGGGCN